MAQVMQPQKKDDKRSILGAVGGVIGGIYGGPSGAMTGYNLGNSAQGMFASGQEGGQAQQVESTAMSRRLGNSSAPAQQQSQDPYDALHQADMALASQSPEVQQEYGPTIKAAKLAARRQNGMA